MRWFFIFVIFAVVLIIAIKGRKPQTVGEMKVVQPIEAETMPMENIALQPDAASVSAEKVAAITAVISLLTGKKASEFVFTAIRPMGQVPAFSAWAVLGTSEIMNTRQQYFERKGN